MNDAYREKKNRNTAFVGVGFAFVVTGIALILTAGVAFGMGFLGTGVVFIALALAKLF